MRVMVYQAWGSENSWEMIYGGVRAGIALQAVEHDLEPICELGFADPSRPATCPDHTPPSIRVRTKPVGPTMSPGTLGM
jgi:hypothetical protein